MNPRFLRAVFPSALLRGALLPAIVTTGLSLIGCGGGGGTPSTPSPSQCGTLVDGQGTPAIVFTSVPPLGSSDLLFGSVDHVAPAANRVVVYIKVNGGWWIKPYDADPQTQISCDGTWKTDIVTGGDDEDANQVTAYLIPESFDPPLLGGDSSIPTSMSGYPSVTATRP